MNGRALLHEIRERRLHRVGGAYVVGFWAALQVGDVVVEPLGLPPWTLTALIWAGLLSAPLVLALAWLYEWAPHGLRRRAILPASRSDSGSDGDSEAGSGYDSDSPRPSDPRRGEADPSRKEPMLTAAVAALLLLGVVGWWAGRAREAMVEPSLVAVLPFRTAGASPELQYLREGMLDLLASRLTGEVSAVSPRTLMRLLAEEGGSPGRDPEPAEARSLARSLGAGRVLEGDLVGRADALTASATLTDVLTGRRIGRGEVTSTSDSITQLVDRLVTQLLAAEGGVSAQRLSAITTGSRPALRAYLEGQQAFRRGEYGAAVREFDRAVALDSTFALAALGLLRASGWSRRDAPNRDRAERLARRGYDDLPPRDRWYLDALAPADRGSPDFTEREALRLRSLAAERAGDDPELWFLAGDGYMHVGEALNERDSYSRALVGLERALELDSTYAEALVHRWDLAVTIGDTATARRLGPRVAALGPRTAARVDYRARRREQGADAMARSDAIRRLAEGGLLEVPWYGDGWRPHPEVLNAAVEGFPHVRSPAERSSRAWTVLGFGLRAGRPSWVEMALESGELPIDIDAKRLELAIFWTGDEAAAASAAQRVQRSLALGRDEWRASIGSLGYLEPHCALGFWHAFRGDTASVRPLAETLRTAPDDDAYRDPDAARAALLCADAIEAGASSIADAPGAADRLERLDRRLGDVPPTGYGPHFWIANMMVARLFEEAGEPDRALAAASRRRGYWGTWEYFVESWGLEARLADAAGDRDRAVENYRRYLSWRDDVEPPFDEAARRARVRLERLTAEGS